MQQKIKRIDTAHYGPMIERSLAEYGGFNTAVKKSGKIESFGYDKRPPPRESITR